MSTATSEKKPKKKPVGRPRRTRQVADQRVAVRFTAVEMRRLRTAAAGAGLTVSEYVRRRTLRG